MKNTQTLFVLVFFLVSQLISCAGSPTRGPEGAVLSASHSKLQLLFGAQRKQAILPCGCSIVPLGGVGREFEALKRFRSRADKSIYLVGGPAFVDSAVPKKDAEKNNTKVDLLVDMMNLLEVSYYFPSAEEFALDKKVLAGIVTKSKFPWIATNLAPKLQNEKISRFAEADIGGSKALLLGVSRNPTRWQKTSEVKVEDPILALKATFAKAKPENYSMVILVTNVEQDVREQIQKEFPFIQLVLGGRSGKKDAGLNVAQEGALRLRAEPEGEGKTLAYIEFPEGVTKKPVQFFSEATVKVWQGSEFQWKEQLYNTEGNIAAAKSVADKKRLNAEKAKWEKFLAWVPEVTQKKEGATVYQGGIVGLDSTYENDHTPLQPLVERYKPLISSVSASGAKQSH